MKVQLDKKRKIDKKVNKERETIKRNMDRKKKKISQQPYRFATEVKK